jgi:hypothetical protein
MQLIVNSAGAAFALLIASTAANAEPTVLADAELDRVAAGGCLAGSGAGYCNDTPGFVILPLSFLPLPTFAPIAPADLPSIGPFIPFWPPAGEYCGPACDPAPLALLAGP